MKRIFPKIEIVDYIATNCRTIGTFNIKTKVLKILKQGKYQMFLVLIHELGHWLINLTTGNSWMHKWYDERDQAKKMRKFKRKNLNV